MKIIKYSITTLSPVIISSESGNQFMISTKDYIPGNVILGALASKYINEKKQLFSQTKSSDPNFLSWFVNCSLIYSNAYKTDIINKEKYPTYPLPFTLHHEKNDDKNIFDLLYDPPSEQDQLNKEKEQSNKTEALNGFGLLRDGIIYITEVNKALSSHHERDYITGSAKTGIFFNYESIKENQTFEGTISGEDKIIEDFFGFVRSINQIKIGRSRSSEYGKIKIEFEKLEDKLEDKPEETIKFNSDRTISLTFLSDVILYNDNGFSSSSYENLHKYLENNIAKSVVIKKAFLKTNEIESYVAVWKMKRPSEISFKAGSCLLLEISGDNNAIVESLKHMKHMQQVGIGERKHEGYGRIMFGLQRNGGYSVGKYDILIPVKPEVSEVHKVPKVVINTTVRIAEKLLNEITVVDALTKVEESIEINGEIKIKSSQLSRLEGFIRSSNSLADFHKIVKNLRETSKKKLVACHFAQSNLFEFLTTENILTKDNIEGKIKAIENLFNDVSIKKQDVENITQKLFVIYYLTLFSAMRKAIKGETNHE